MANITPQMVKELRDKTGAGMAECKKALDEAQGNMDEAVDVLRKRGAASAAKRSDRSANEGAVVSLVNSEGTLGVIVEINCETDFVARNDEFVAYSNEIGKALLSNEISNEEQLWSVSIGAKTLGDLHNEILAKFSEKIGVKRFERCKGTDGTVVPYVHAGSKLGVLVQTKGKATTDKAIAMLRDVAMQVAAMKPLFVDRNSVDLAAVTKEIEIYREQAVNEGKKPEIADKIAQGRLEKYYQENCLIEQSFVKDGNKTIKDVLKDISNEVGQEISITGFTRYYLGEE